MQFHLLSFEGPDDYARAGGIATRVSGLAQAMATMGHDTHLWFIGDPDLPGYERRDRLHLHRWCQWISGYHRGGVYDGEEGKRLDYAASLPPSLLEEVLAPALQEGPRAVILAEEWHTVDAVLHVDWLLRRNGLRDRVTILWNANNNYSFERIDWQSLARAATITTVSRYMKHLMWRYGVDPLVISNGLAAEAFNIPRADAVSHFRRRISRRSVISKVARWHPDKRWLIAIDIVAAMKAKGLRPLLVARGGVEAHGADFLAAAKAAGLRVADRASAAPGSNGLLFCMNGAEDADIVNLRMPLNEESSRLLFHCSDAVLANSGHEPFGLVGLETMAVGGVACVGTSGEDYAVPGYNALVLETNDPQEFIAMFQALHGDSAQKLALRRDAQATAKRYAWPQIIERVLLPRLAMLAASASGVLRRTSPSADAVPTNAANALSFRGTRRRAPSSSSLVGIGVA